MRVEVNNANHLLAPNTVPTRPSYKGEILRTVGFGQYCPRPPINANELKNSRPNDGRFVQKEWLPPTLSNVDYK